MSSRSFYLVFSWLLWPKYCDGILFFDNGGISCKIIDIFYFIQSVKSLGLKKIPRKKKVILHGAFKLSNQNDITFFLDFQNSMNHISSSCDNLILLGICNMITNKKQLINFLQISSIESLSSKLGGTFFIWAYQMNWFNLI